MRNPFSNLFSSPAEHASSAIPELHSVEQVEDLLGRDLAIVFKHSNTCITSAMAHRQVMAFHARHPDVPIHIVMVRRHRNVSNHIAERLNIEHESPQVIVLVKGSVVASTSHDGVTVDFLRECIREHTAQMTTGAVTKEPQTSR